MQQTITQSGQLDTPITGADEEQNDASEYIKNDDGTDECSIKYV